MRGDLAHIFDSSLVQQWQPVGFHALTDGMRFLRTHPVILAVISLDFFATFFGSPMSLLPIFASAILHVNAQGLGILLAADSLGAIALTPLTGRIGRIVRQGLGITLPIIVWGCVSSPSGFFPFHCGWLRFSSLEQEPRIW